MKKFCMFVKMKKETQRTAISKQAFQFGYTLLVVLRVRFFFVWIKNRWILGISCCFRERNKRIENKYPNHTRFFVLETKWQLTIMINTVMSRVFEMVDLIKIFMTYRSKWPFLEIENKRTNFILIFRSKWLFRELI